MAVLLLILGVVVAACGLATIGFGVSLSESTLGAALLRMEIEVPDDVAKNARRKHAPITR